MKRLRVCVILVLVLSLATVSVASAGRNATPGVLPPNARVQGLSYGEWQVVMWQHLLPIPLSNLPLYPLGPLPETCFYDRIGNVGLAFGGVESFEADCHMPSGMMLSIVILVAECSTLEPPPFHGDDEQSLRECATEWATPTSMDATIDGVPVVNLSDYLATSPLFEFTVPEGNWLGVPAGTGEAVSYGTALMTEPLSVGQHTIEVHGVNAYMDYEAIYHVTVTPGH